MVILIPGYREVTEDLLAQSHDLRARGVRPMSTMPEDRWKELMEYAEMKIAAAKEIESDALKESYPRPAGMRFWEAPEPPTRERYKARLDDARRAIYMTRDEQYAMTGKNLSIAQAKRRKDKPATDAHMDGDRNTRIRNSHARLVAAGAQDATAQVATQFSLSLSQIRRIVARARA